MAEEPRRQVFKWVGIVGRSNLGLSKGITLKKIFIKKGAGTKHGTTWCFGGKLKGRSRGSSQASIAKVLESIENIYERNKSWESKATKNLRSE